MTRDERAYREAGKYVEIRTESASTRKVTLYSFNWNTPGEVGEVEDVQHLPPGKAIAKAVSHKRHIARLISKNYNEYFNKE